MELKLTPLGLVDSVSYYITNPDGADPNSIYDFTTVNISQPLQLSNTATQNTSLDYGDCDAQIAVNVFGGTPPYSIEILEEDPLQ